jgi:predicted LPLAT superfamily acyltransferase
MNRWYRHRYHTQLSHRLVFAIIPRLPRFLHPPIALVTAALFLILLPTERRAVKRNLAIISGASGPKAWWTTFRVFYSFCDFIVSYCYIPNADHDTLVGMLTEPERAAADIARCLSEGNGLIAWTAHLGNWELASRLLELHGRPVNVARAVEPGNDAETMLRDLMSSERLRVVDVNDDLASVRLLHALRANEIVAIQGDRVYGGRDVELPFFGRPARFPAGPFLLSYFSGAPVLPCVVVRTGWLRYRMLAGEPIRVDRAAGAEAAARDGVERAAMFLERQLLGWHNQWLNFFDFWQDDPGEDARQPGARGRKVQGAR